MENEKIKHRCCFTGHRPDKIELGEKEIKPLLEKSTVYKGLHRVGI